jgi:allantoate deiminase
MVQAAAMTVKSAETTAAAARLLERCDAVASFSEQPGRITRRFLSAPVGPLHERLAGWFREAGMTVRTDAVGNLIGRRPASEPPEGRPAKTLLIGSHIDTVPDAGRYDGVLGVLAGLALVELLDGRRMPYAIEVIAFSEEEGVRFATPYIGSLAAAGRFDPALLAKTDAAGVTLEQAIRGFGLDPAGIPAAAYRPDDLLAYFEIHIEQGPVLESQNLPVALVEAIAGQSRLWVSFHGQAGHAGTCPMEHRRDALAAAADLVTDVERTARTTPGLRATVGCLSVEPGATNVVPGRARMSLDVRHADDSVRLRALGDLIRNAQAYAQVRRLGFEIESRTDQPAVPADRRLGDLLADCLGDAGLPALRMLSGAGHDAAVMASVAPMCMLFVRSPGGISHHPDEAVNAPDVAAALEVGLRFLRRLER